MQSRKIESKMTFRQFIDIWSRYAVKNGRFDQVCLRLDQSVQEPSALSSQSYQASDCHCKKMFHRLDQICELQWQSEERQIWLPMAGGSCTGWSNLRYIGRIYDFCRYCLGVSNFVFFYLREIRRCPDMTPIPCSFCRWLNLRKGSSISVTPRLKIEKKNEDLY